jgi:uncharacterized membrane protein
LLLQQQLVISGLLCLIVAFDRSKRYLGAWNAVNTLQDVAYLLRIVVKYFLLALNFGVYGPELRLSRRNTQIRPVL